MANSLYKVNENKQLVPINWIPFKQMTKAQLKALTNPLPAGTIVNVTDKNDIAEVGLKADLPNPTQTIAENIASLATVTLKTNVVCPSEYTIATSDGYLRYSAWGGDSSNGELYIASDASGTNQLKTVFSGIDTKYAPTYIRKGIFYRFVPAYACNCQFYPMG